MDDVKKKEDNNYLFKQHNPVCDIRVLKEEIKLRPRQRMKIMVLLKNLVSEIGHFRH